MTEEGFALIETERTEMAESAETNIVPAEKVASNIWETVIAEVYMEIVLEKKEDSAEKEAEVLTQQTTEEVFQPTETSVRQEEETVVITTEDSAILTQAPTTEPQSPVELIDTRQSEICTVDLTFVQDSGLAGSDLLIPRARKCKLTTYLTFDQNSGDIPLEEVIVNVDLKKPVEHEDSLVVVSQALYEDDGKSCG